MKFDYIVMNPPYGESGPGLDPKLYLKFFKAALELADNVVSIQPATWMTNKKDISELNLKNKDLSIIAYTQQESTDLFRINAGVTQNLCIVKACPGNGQASVLFNKTGQTVNYANIADYNQYDKFGDLGKSILTKSKNLSDTILNQHTNSNGRSQTEGKALGGLGCIVSSRSQVIRDPSILKGKWIVKLTNIIQSAEKSLSPIITNGSVPYQHDGTKLPGHVYCVFDTQKQAMNFRAYCLTDFVCFLGEMFLNGCNNYSFKYIPWVPDNFNTQWDDDRIAQEIGLTDPERTELASILPDCYNIRI